MVWSASLAGIGGMAEFFAELKRRQMFRVAAAYAVVAWLLLQLFNNIAPIYELPPWVGRAFVFLLALGFPIVLVFSLIQNLGAGEATPRAKTSRLDWILVG